VWPPGDKHQGTAARTGKTVSLPGAQGITMEKLGAQLVDLSAEQLDGVAAWLAVRKKTID